MFQRFIRSILIVAVAMVALLSTANSVDAKRFKQTEVMELKYGWGTTSLMEFDEFDLMYPGYFPIADLTFYRDGTFDAYDRYSGSTGGGTYSIRGKTIIITIGSPSPFGIVEYVGTSVASGEYAGEILVDGEAWGHWRGELL